MNKILFGSVVVRYIRILYVFENAVCDDADSSRCQLARRYTYCSRVLSRNKNENDNDDGANLQMLTSTGFLIRLSRDRET